MAPSSITVERRPIKITVVGDGTVGKTCLLLVHAGNEFPKEYIPTVFDEYSSTITIDKKSYTVTLWDTAGQEAYDRLRPLTYPNTDVFLICYSVDNETSFANIETKWVREVKSYCPKVPFVLVGTKADRRNDSDSCISEKDGKNLAKKIGAARLVECSALRMTNVHQVFEVAVCAALNLSTNKSTCGFL